MITVVPNAHGFGMDTPAGRGGQIIHVTNNNNSGAGSLREALETSGPRVIVFDLSVDIFLSSQILVDNPFFTLAGQTAPAPGVMIRGAGINIRTNDFLVQHIAIRPGDDPDGQLPENRDGLLFTQNEGTVDRGVIDHVSLTWSVDELMSVWHGQPKHLTFYRCIFAEPLHNSIHPQGPHGFGPTVFDDHKIAFIENFMGFNRGRMPWVEVSQFYFANNMVFNWTGRATDFHGQKGLVQQAVLLNNNWEAQGGQHAIEIRSDVNPNSKIYLEGNIGKNFDGDQWSMVDNAVGASIKAVSAPFTIAGHAPIAASSVKANVIANAGARCGSRDAVDSRIMANLDTDNQIGTIDSPSDVGGYPTWAKNSHAGGWPEPANPHDDSGDGYTILEKQLHKEAAAVESTGEMIMKLNTYWDDETNEWVLTWDGIEARRGPDHSDLLAAEKAKIESENAEAINKIGQLQDAITAL